MGNYFNGISLFSSLWYCFIQCVDTIHFWIKNKMQNLSISYCYCISHSVGNTIHFLIKNKMQNLSLEYCYCINHSVGDTIHFWIKNKMQNLSLDYCYCINHSVGHTIKFWIKNKIPEFIHNVLVLYQSFNEPYNTFLDKK